MKPDEILVVDLDGTLLRSDMLYESFWSAFGKDWRSPFLSVGALMGGRASLKRHLALASSVQAPTLPYDPEVIAYVKAWRASGARTALVTASDQSFAEAVVAHLGIFDEAYGSDGQSNLKGERKGDFLEKRFGSKGFAYMGDASADVPVWRRASKAITVNAPMTVRQSAEQVCAQVEHLVTQTRSITPYIKAMRPHQWLKNMIVFLPLLAAHRFDAQAFILSGIAFVSFSLIASSVYVLNDLLDLGADRAHPRKKNRPFAAGRIPLAHGTWMAAGLLGLGGGLAISISAAFLMVMAGYYLLTLAYSLHLKRRAVIDICVLAALYTARIIAGGVATGIALSVWLLAFSSFFFLSLAAVKRQAELIDTADRGTQPSSGRGYVVTDLPIISMIAIGAGYVSVLVMALYVNSPAVAGLYVHPQTLWGICAVLFYWITRTVLIAHRGQMHDDPVVYAAKDRISQMCLLVMLGLALAGAVA